MLATLQTVAGLGEYGELIKASLGERRIARGVPKISYEQLAQIFKARGIKDPKTQEEITKSRITSYANDRALTPQWFLEALGSVLGGPELGYEGEWWKTGDKSGKLSLGTSSRQGSTIDRVRYRTVEVDEAPAMSAGGLRRTYLPQKENQEWKQIALPNIIICDTAVGVRIDRDVAMPHWQPGKSIAFLDTSRQVPTLDKIYACTEENGEANFRKAVWDQERGRMVLRAAMHARRRYPDALAEPIQGPFENPEKPVNDSSDLVSCWVDGLVFVVQTKIVGEGQVPPMIIDPEGVEVENW